MGSLRRTAPEGSRRRVTPGGRTARCPGQAGHPAPDVECAGAEAFVVAQWIAGWQSGWAAETDAIWAVAEAGSGVLLGRAGLKHLKFSDGTADVAYWTVPAARGKGVCPRAVDAMASWAFEAGFHRLDLEHAMGNTASWRVAEETGFAVEGVRRCAWLLADGRHDVHAHARLRS